MKSITTIIIISFHLLTFSQTLKETQDWIKEKIEGFAYAEDETSGHLYNVSFTETDMILNQTLVFLELGSSTEITSVIPIKEINKVVFEEKIETTWMTISLKEDKKHILETIDYGETSTEYVDKVVLIFFKFYAQNLDTQNSIIEAFRRLVNAYGGNLDED